MQLHRVAFPILLYPWLFFATAIWTIKLRMYNSHLRLKLRGNHLQASLGDSLASCKALGCKWCWISSTTLCATWFLSSRMTVNQSIYFFWNYIFLNWVNWVLTWNCATWRLLFFSAGPSCQVSFQCQSKHSNPDWQEGTYKNNIEGNRTLTTLFWILSGMLFVACLPRLMEQNTCHVWKANSYRLQEECDVLTLVLAKQRVCKRYGIPEYTWVQQNTIQALDTGLDKSFFCNMTTRTRSQGSKKRWMFDDVCGCCLDIESRETWNLSRLQLGY